MLRRHLADVVAHSLTEFPAVLLLGARQVGKSTLAQQMVAEGRLTGGYVTLDELAVLEAARSDPERFVEESGDGVAIDEIQRVPDLMRALKRSIDLRREPGRFLLTGSANVLSRPEVGESLAGRVDVIPLEGLSLAELDGRDARTGLLDGLLAQDAKDELIQRLRAATREGDADLTRETVERRLFFGGFPDVALRASARFTDRWFASYVTAYVERDVRNLTRLPDMVAFGRFLRLVALRTANLLNLRNLATDAAIDQRTAARYLELLEVTFQIHRLQPWHTSTAKRLVKSPKIFLRDSGLATHFAGIRKPEELAGHPAIGALLETWVLAELRKLCAITSGIELSFYRSHGGREVDFVLERGSAMLGIEIKSNRSVTSSDFRGLRELRELAGPRCVGVLFYLGDEVLPFGDGLAAAPLRALV